ncbi:MAG TPA: hypothetical protein VGR90_11560 [Acidimicrobiales bacterium]|nr:hypothetical protein [Acidimicrobiales bacterium]
MNIKSLLQGKKRYVVAGVTAVTLGGGAFAFANSLTVTSDTLGSGSPANGVASPASHCNPTMSFTTVWDDTTQKFDVNTVTATTSDLSDAAAACSADTITAELQGGTGPSSYTSLQALPKASYIAGAGASPGPATNDYYTWQVYGSANSGLNVKIDASTVTNISAVVEGTS